MRYLQCTEAAGGKGRGVTTRTRDSHPDDRTTEERTGGVGRSARGAQTRRELTGETRELPQFPSGHPRRARGHGRTTNGRSPKRDVGVGRLGSALGVAEGLRRPLACPCGSTQATARRVRGEIPYRSRAVGDRRGSRDHRQEGKRKR